MTTAFKKSALFAAALLAGGLLTGAAVAQSAQPMDLLSEAERRAFNQRLQDTGTSSGRAKITAEMNRLVQQRRLEQRRLERKKSAQKSHE